MRDSVWAAIAHESGVRNLVLIRGGLVSLMCDEYDLHSSSRENESIMFL